MKYLAVLFLLALSFIGCKPSVPSAYIQPGEMEDILYEYHLAEGIQVHNNEGGDTLSLLSYKSNILKKHGYTVAEFDSSMLYYTRHTKLLSDIYVSLADRLNKESVAQGSTVNELNRYGNISSSSDTTDIWSGERAFVISPYRATNQYYFEEKVDTSFHKGDLLMLDFDTQFIYQDGLRDAIVVLAVTFTNDSIATQTIHASSSSHYQLQIGDDEQGIKRIRGYFILGSNGDMSTTTLKMLIVSNISFIRMHRTIKPANKSKEADANIKDTLIRNKEFVPSEHADEQQISAKPLIQGNIRRKK